MILRINKTSSVTPGLILSIIRAIKNETIINLTESTLVRPCEDYLNTGDIQKQIFTKDTKIKVQNLVMNLLSNLTYTILQDYYIIKFNDNIKLQNCLLNCADLAAFLNYGNLEMEGLLIFSKAFQKIENNFDYYKTRYFMFYI